MQLGDLDIDVPARRVHLDGRSIALTPSEFALLLALARLDGIVVPPRDLLNAMWDGSWESDTTPVQVHISRLRAKLGESAAAPRYIHTVRGMGYRFDPRPPPRLEPLSPVRLQYDGGLVLVSVDPHRAFLGWEPSEILGTDFSFAGQGRDGHRALVEALTATGLHEMDHVIPLRHADGQPRARRAISRILLDGGGRLDGLDTTLFLAPSDVGDTPPGFGDATGPLA